MNIGIIICIHEKKEKIEVVFTSEETTEKWNEFNKEDKSIKKPSFLNIPSLRAQRLQK